MIVFYKGGLAETNSRVLPCNTTYDWRDCTIMTP